jgi:hypothetical protein
MLAAPARFSTTTCWPSARDSGSAIIRLRMSGAEPAASALISLIGRVGQVSAAAGAAATNERARSAAVAAAPARKSVPPAIVTSGMYLLFTRTAMRMPRP